jgi:hypothetical protein
MRLRFLETANTSLYFSSALLSNFNQVDSTVTVVWSEPASPQLISFFLNLYYCVLLIC